MLDPFANRIVFHQLVEEVPTEGGGTAAGPIEHEYVVACSPEHAFAVYTGEIDTWSPDGYSPPGKEHVRSSPESGARARCCWPTGRRTPGDVWRVGAARATTRWTSPWPRTPTTPAASTCGSTSSGEGSHPNRFSHGGWHAGNVAGRARFSEWPIILDRFVAWAEGRPLGE